MKKGHITVHHVKDASSVVADIKLYCGRGQSKYPELIDADMGNPFYMADESARNAVCKAYRESLEFDSNHPHWKRIKRIAQRVTEGKAVALFCYCAPKACHCDTIKELARLEVIL